MEGAVAEESTWDSRGRWSGGFASSGPRSGSRASSIGSPGTTRRTAHTARSVVGVLEHGVAHCIEAAFVGCRGPAPRRPPPSADGYGGGPGRRRPCRGPVPAAAASGGRSPRATAPCSATATRSTAPSGSCRSRSFPSTSRAAGRRCAPIRCRSISGGTTRRSGSPTRRTAARRWSTSSPCARHFPLVPAELEERPAADRRDRGAAAACSSSTSEPRLVAAGDASPPPIAAWPSSFRRAVIAISPNCRGGTRQSRGLWSSTATPPA